MKTIEVQDMPKYIEATKNTGINLLFIGDTGIGKTQVIERYCKDHGTFLVTLNLARLEASEALGIPVQSTREFEGKTYHVLDTAIPSWVFALKEHEDNAMLFCDELLCAEPSTMNSFLTFFSGKKVSNIDLSKITIVAATNLGNYTFDPDNNILSRFCMFYVENTKFDDFINKKKETKTVIVNSYVDETDKSNDVIFGERSLKPRCQEALSMLTDIDLIRDCYEGFTNRKYIVFSTIPKVNSIFSTAQNLMDEDKYKTIAKMLKVKYPRVKVWDKNSKIYKSIIDKDEANYVFDYLK